MTAERPPHRVFLLALLPGLLWGAVRMTVPMSPLVAFVGTLLFWGALLALLFWVRRR